MMKKIVVFTLVLIAFKLASCARIGSPSGGPMDSIPPVMVYAKPLNKTTSFKEKEIVILFDEYIKFNNLTSQLIISPPMEQKPDITPTSGVSKKISIEFLEPLTPNTTYTINFGNSIVDNNEGNELGRFSYVFSTGEELDSLSMAGNVYDPLSDEKLENISLMAYKNAHDTLVGNYTPNYLTNTLDSNYFILENLSEATYKLIALEDVNNNYKYDKGYERIGFLNKNIELNKPIDSLKFILFLEEKNARIFRPTQAKGNQIILGFSGKQAPELELKGVSENNYLVTKEADKDSLYIWFKEIPKDTVKLYAKVDTLHSEFNLKPRELKKDSISITSLISGTLHPRDSISLFTSIPVENINRDSIIFLEKDSIPVPFQIISEPKKHKLIVNFDRNSNSSYSVDLRQAAFTDYLGFKSSPQKINFRTLDPEEYGEIILDVVNENNINLIIDLLDSKKNKITQMIHESGKVAFRQLVPEKYTVRVTKDLNDNKVYDNGNFADRIQPEEIINFKKEMTLRANSELNEIIKID